MAVSGTTGTTTPFGREEFLKLLLAQVQNQNPLEPLKDADFMAQMAQFSTVEGIERLNASFQDMLVLQQLTQGANLVGRTVSYELPGASGLQRGVVDGVSVQDGRLVATIAGTNVPVELIRGIERPPA